MCAARRSPVLPSSCLDLGSRSRALPFPEETEGPNNALDAALVNVAGKGLEDILAKRGNEHLSDFLTYSRQEVIGAAVEIEADEPWSSWRPTARASSGSSYIVRPRPPCRRPAQANPSPYGSPSFGVPSSPPPG